MVSSCWVIATDSCGNSDSLGFELLPYELETSILYNEIIHIAEELVLELWIGHKRDGAVLVEGPRNA